jgi:G3E family GTPase
VGRVSQHDLSGVGSVGLTMEGDIDDVVFNAFMQSLLQAKARDIYRSKGVLSIHGQGDMKFVFQGVHEQMNFGPSLAEWKAGVRALPSPFCCAVHARATETPRVAYHPTEPNAVESPHTHLPAALSAHLHTSAARVSGHSVDTNVPPPLLGKSRRSWRHHNASLMLEAPPPPGGGPHRSRA